MTSAAGGRAAAGGPAPDGGPRVLILMGSDSDLPVMQEAGRVLGEFGVPFEITVASAHRSPDRAATYAREAEGRGVRVIIAGAGGAAHLAGILAAHTPLPVIGVPLGGSAVNGLDALLATVQMPAGVPVATVAIGGARNAALLAVQILATADDTLRDRYRAYKARLAREVEEKAARITTAATGGFGMAPPRAGDSARPETR
ncbi:MAG TPA: 5-(carboxyamino)imidazole ribonucleotide mutase [bacterium]|nr:5-(carboxyamino)imidazole ribonucleotide mutase [bacterium]